MQMHSRQLAKFFEGMALLNSVVGAACLATAMARPSVSYPTSLAWAAAMAAILTVLIPALKWASEIVLPRRPEPPHLFDEGGLSAEEIGHLVQYSPRLYKILAFTGVVVGIAAIAFDQPGGSSLSGALTRRDLASVGGALIFFSLLALPIHGSVARWKD